MRRQKRGRAQHIARVCIVCFLMRYVSYCDGDVSRLYGLSDCIYYLLLCRDPLREVSEEGEQVHPRAERAGVDQAWPADH